MSFAKSFRKAVRKVYNATSDSHSKFGRKFGKFAYPFNAQYFARDAWRSVRKKLAGSNSAVSVNSFGSGGGYLGSTGFRRSV